ncbi:MAG: acylphosphatase [Patescibacteria group bacterium]
MSSAFVAVASGRVQVVRYRSFALRHARRLGVVGTVENLKDGTVRIVAEGERNVLEQFISLLKRGPFLAEVKDVAVQWTQPGNGYRSFTITNPWTV